jgi:hypothetical protein
MVRIAKRKIRPRQAVAKAERGLEPLAYSIAEFAELHGFSIDSYFRPARSGAGPRTMKVGARTLISCEAAEAWRREREEATARKAGAETLASR